MKKSGFRLNRENINHIDILNDDECYGCTSCYHICPRGAISLEYDEEGFAYFRIGKGCISCGRCLDACPRNYGSLKKAIDEGRNKGQNGGQEEGQVASGKIAVGNAYAAFNNDEQARKTASSGGVFELLARAVLKEGGVVVGAAFDEKNNLRHVAVESVDELEMLKGSKYIQSSLGDIFVDIKNYISNRKVLFVGTPCQVNGLKVYLKKSRVADDNLYCCDFICHGVPSKRVFDKYIAEREAKGGKLVGNVNFRNKDNGWKHYNVAIEQEERSYCTEFFNDVFMKLFLSDICLRPSCYNCYNRGEIRCSDLTLGDFWKINRFYKDLNDDKGISAVIVNTPKGADMFDSICSDMTYRECTVDEIAYGNHSLRKPAKPHKNRDKFFADLDKYDLDELYVKYARANVFKRAFRRLKNKISD